MGAGAGMGRNDRRFSAIPPMREPLSKPEGLPEQRVPKRHSYGGGDPPFLHEPPRQPRNLASFHTISSAPVDNQESRAYLYDGEYAQESEGPLDSQETSRQDDMANPHICEACGRGFRQKGDMNRHCTSKHGGNGAKYVCPEPECPSASKVFRRRDNLRDHLKRIHKPGTGDMSGLLDRGKLA
ncbi:hypothetical protein FGG08_000812 [Glutinoglossum americanum]|uniref:C2H2-type domain-containing protein n=1 Tax=Glutinoglossum americanum TaxID=1670608 RepID=A0A9P8I337_9PEZI|nr:hypothetical protein FGG08_000812 [Glutinoglossum americanum]